MTSFNYPPLTTPFIVPSTCFNEPKVAFTNSPNAGDVELQLAIGATCLPANTQRQSWYSPGMCMQDWTTVASATQSNGRVVAACCPKDYQATSRSGQVCASAFTTSRTVRCLSENNATPSILPSGTCQTTVVPSGVAVQLPIFVAYEPKDLSLFPSGYTPGQALLAVSTSAASIARTSTSSATSQSSTSPSGTSTLGTSPAATTSSGLSTAAKIGIGLGVPLGILLIAAIFLVGFFYGKRRKRQPTRLHESTETEPYMAPELSAKTGSQQSHVSIVEMDASGIHELPSPIAGSEMAADSKFPKI